jgi:hypothetical protein
MESKNMLPDLLPGARILKYGYESKWFGKDAVKMSLQGITELLLLSLKSDSGRQVQTTSF